jgi:hypothetical protein
MRAKTRGERNVHTMTAKTERKEGNVNSEHID